MVLAVAPFFLFVEDMSAKAAEAFLAAAAGMMTAANLVPPVGEGLERAPRQQAWEVAAGAFVCWVAARWVRRVDDFDVASP